MTEEFDIHEIISDGEGENGGDPDYKKRMGPAFRKISIELTEKDLEGRGARILLLQEIHRLQGEVNIVRRRTKDYTDIKIEAEVLRERVRSFKSHSATETITLIVGGALLGHASRMWEDADWYSNIDAIITLTLGIILLVGSIGFRLFRFNKNDS